MYPLNCLNRLCLLTKPARSYTLPLTLEQFSIMFSISIYFMRWLACSLLQMAKVCLCLLDVSGCTKNTIQSNCMFTLSKFVLPPNPFCLMNICFSKKIFLYTHSIAFHLTQGEGSSIAKLGSELIQKFMVGVLKKVALSLAQFVSIAARLAQTAPICSKSFLVSVSNMSFVQRLISICLRMLKNGCSKLIRIIHLLFHHIRLFFEITTPLGRSLYLRTDIMLSALAGSGLMFLSANFLILSCKCSCAALFAS